MKKSIKVLLFIFVCALSLFVVTSCEEKTGEPTKEPPVTDEPPATDEPSAGNTKTPAEVLDGLSLSNTKVDYDGKAHSILLVGDIPEDAEIKYYGNEKTEPGKYQIIAEVTYKEEKRQYYAQLVINKKASTLEAAAVQEDYVGDVNGLPKYTLGNEEQKINATVKRNGVLVDLNSLYRPGEYEVEIYAEASAHYEASDHVTIKYTVKESNLGVSFKDVDAVVDGNVKEVVLQGTLPTGYTVEYTNNSAKDYGTYFATAKIKDSTGKIVETHRATLNLDYADDAQFEDYLDTFFKDYLEGDQLSVNIFCENPSDFGLERYDAVWYTYSRDTDSSSTDGKAYFEEYIASLHEFSTSNLSKRQKIAYNQIDRFLNYQKNQYNFENIDFLNNHYVDQFGGYVADFGTYMEAYTLREEADVQDIVNFTLSTEEAFKSYILYLEDKAEAGYPLSDFTLDAMSEYLQDVIDSTEKDGKYYLSDTLTAKIDAVTFLTDDKKTEYKTKIQNAIATEFMNGVVALQEGVLAQKGKLAAENEGYWAAYENGSQLFEMELDYLLGLDDFDVKTYISEVEQELFETSDKTNEIIDDIITKYRINTMAQLENLLAQAVIYSGTPEEMMVFLKEFAKTIVPELKTSPNITIKEMDEASAKVSNAVAYYMKSALDNTSSEFITLNPVKLGDKNDVLGTLSHEGYPGHLYAYCYSKELNLHNISKIMTSTAHGEGWATYVEIKLYEYAIKSAKTQKQKDIFTYLYYNQLSGFLLETRVDAGIHLENWGVEKVASYLDSLGYSSDSAEKIYNLLIETPCSYASYGYGKLFYVKLHDQAKETLGNYYDEVEFNAVLLSKGWTSLGELQRTVDEYLLVAKHRYIGA